MSIRVASWAMPVLAGGLGCSPPEGSPRPAASFVNRVWVVAESEQVAGGELRVFLSEGTLVMAAPHATPAFGSWRYRGDSLTITEEGRDYPVDIVELTEDTFRIRIRGPGEPVLIRFRPARPAEGTTRGNREQER
jgi:hypothetical protein